MTSRANPAAPDRGARSRPTTSPRPAPPRPAPPRTTPSARKQWSVATGLLVLCVVPVGAGAARLAELTSGAVVTADNARFFDSPVPVAVHIVTASVFCVLGTLQLVPAFRRRFLVWHRRAGRVVAASGVLAALSGLWMTFCYPWPAGDGRLLAGVRLVVGVAMVASIVVAVAAARRRDLAAHRAWMLRGYALGLGAGTQALVHLPWLLLAEPPTGTPRALLLTAGWAINLAIAELVISSRRVRSERRSRRTPAPSARAARRGP